MENNIEDTSSNRHGVIKKNNGTTSTFSQRSASRSLRVETSHNLFMPHTGKENTNSNSSHDPSPIVSKRKKEEDRSVTDPVSLLKSPIGGLNTPTSAFQYPPTAYWPAYYYNYNSSWQATHPPTSNASQKDGGQPKLQQQYSNSSNNDPSAYYYPYNNTVGKSKYASTSSSSNQRDYINPDIKDLALSLKLPQEGRKFSVQHWKDALLLLYRWKTTTNEVEQKLFGESTASCHSSLSYSSTKSVKAFCDKVIRRESKRRQFSIHWKESGLKKLVEEYEYGGDDDDGDDETNGKNPRVEYDDPKLGALLDDYFSGRKRKAGYQLAKEKAMEHRQEQINKLWKDLTSTGKQKSATLPLEQLKMLQDFIEQPFQMKIQFDIENGRKATHHVTIDGFDGRSVASASLQDKKKPILFISGTKKVPSQTSADTAEASEESTCESSNSSPSTKEKDTNDVMSQSIKKEQAVVLKDEENDDEAGDKENMPDSSN